ncbi:hypothetical protein BDN70DRAFT_930452 [Pholiota conissans]|uniref:Uncharacterized protein n=1 Tax=Pholiota conissans TaxID=109636 RepID=A0A9P5Z844_9AGAR|nr:hypothetical protein BDN70DRAFT_930452 [Pholiota conissans]
MAILLFPRLPTPPPAQCVPPGSLALYSLDNGAILMAFILTLKGGGTSEDDVRIVTPDIVNICSITSSLFMPRWTNNDSCLLFNSSST